MDSGPLRVVIRVRVQDIPSDRYRRVRCLGNIFCEQVLGREMNHALEAECHDADHYLPSCDSANDVKAWFIYDFNVTGPLDKAELMKIPHRVYLATRQEDSW